MWVGALGIASFTHTPNSGAQLTATAGAPQQQVERGVVRFCDASGSLVGAGHDWRMAGPVSPTRRLRGGGCQRMRRGGLGGGAGPEERA